jgi:hypothetical protein
MAVPDGGTDGARSAAPPLRASGDGPALGV